MNRITANLAIAAAFASNAAAPVEVAVTERDIESYRPAMAPRPDGMSRQLQRALYRKLCKRNGLDWRRKRK